MYSVAHVVAEVGSFEVARPKKKHLSSFRKRKPLSRAGSVEQAAKTTWEWGTCVGMEGPLGGPDVIKQRPQIDD
jgi:hypothetical protein